MEPIITIDSLSIQIEVKKGQEREKERKARRLTHKYKTRVKSDCQWHTLQLIKMQNYLQP